jgi:uncharacterized membrane protein YeiH
MEHTVFVLVDLLGTFAFATSGAIAAEQRRLDLFGVIALSYLTATGGGIFRDLCLGALPPVGISNWRYLGCSMIAAAFTIWARPIVDRIKHPVMFFDSFGLGFYAVVGAHKALLYGSDVEVAMILGAVTAVGGGALRDVVLNRVPIILQKEIYALAALAGAAVQVLGQKMEWWVAVTPWFGASVCCVIRFLSLRYSWNLPVAGKKDTTAGRS